jgi:hypothetical protein
METIKRKGGRVRGEREKERERETRENTRATVSCANMR